MCQHHRTRLLVGAPRVLLAAFEHGDGSTALIVLGFRFADLVGTCQVHGGLNLVGQAQHRWVGAGLLHRTQRGHTLVERMESKGLVELCFWVGVHMHAHAGDYAEQPFGAQEQLLQRRSRRGRW